MRIQTLAACLIGFTLMAARPLQVDDLFKIRRVAEPQLSAKGDMAYQVAIPDAAANRTQTRIWFRSAGSPARPLDLGEGNQSTPRFSPDGGRLAYCAGDQLWVVDLKTHARKRITSLEGGASEPVWSPDGKWLAFASTTVPSGDAAENAAYLKAKGERKTTGMVFDTLMYRHWTEWRDAMQVSHLFVVPADGSQAPRDLTPGWKHDIPNFAGVAAGEDVAWSPDSRSLAFGSHPEAEKAISTNGEIYEVSLAGGPIRKLSDNPAMDTTPRYSPDGRYIAWRAQETPGFEADRWEIRVFDRATGKQVASTKTLDRHMERFVWKGGEIIIQVPDQGRQELYRWDLKAAPRPITRGLCVENFSLSADGSKALAQITDSATPVDLYDIDLASGKTTRATDHNAALAAELGLNRAEAIWVKGAPDKEGKAPMVQAWVIKPVGFDPSKRYPVAFVIHGGPQGSNNDSWHPRWCAQAWAGRGFVTVLPNPRGSTGFGQAFCDEISGDWSGRVMGDLMNVLDEVFRKVPNADPARVVAAGGSYGGYAVNWLAGHQPDRFAAFVSHAGIFNTESMQLATEELWFPRHEYNGFPWDSPAARQTWEVHSPHRAAGAFKKPMLVIHGMKDYRVVYTEALQLYNVHQLRQIPSRLLIFPDEGHFVAKPANSKLWYETVLEWCERWTKEGAAK